MKLLFRLRLDSRGRDRGRGEGSCGGGSSRGGGRDDGGGGTQGSCLLQNGVWTGGRGRKDIIIIVGSRGL